MTVLHITTSTSGGAAVACIRLHQGLQQSTVNSEVLCLKDYKNMANRVPQIHEFADNFFKTIIRKGKFWIYEQKLKSKLRNQQPGFETFSTIDTMFDITRHPLYIKADIIHLHWICGFMDFVSFFKKNTKPVVWTLHDMFPFTGGCHHADGCEGFVTDCNNCPQLKNCPDKQLALNQLCKKREAMLQSDSVIIVTPSSWLNNLSAKSSLFKKYPHYVIPNGVDETVFCPGNKAEARKKLKLATDNNIILFVAHSVSNFRKGSHLLFEAVSKLKTEKVQIIAAGKTNGLPNDLPFMSLGEIDDPHQMALAYQAADLFVLPSLAENLPNTIAESLLCGTPATGFNVGGIPEMIIDGQTGFLCKKITATNLAETIDLFFKEKHTFNATEIRNISVEKYSRTKQSEQYKNLYNRIIKQTET